MNNVVGGKSHWIPGTLARVPLAAVALGGCGELLDLDWTPEPSDGGQAGATAAEGGARGGAASTGGSSAAPSYAGSSTAAPCDAAACPATGSSCRIPTCVEDACAIANAPAGAPCSEGGGDVCDGAGTCVECVGDEQCRDGRCEHNHCYGCGDGMQNGAETDVDCGGPECKNCHAGQHCLTNYDCKKSRCEDGTCVDGGH